MNVASRLESLNEVYGTEIIIGESTYRQIQDRVVVRLLDRVAVYGKETGIAMYELLSMRDGAGPDLADWIAVYERARAAMRLRNWDEAITLFKEVIRMRGGHDPVSSLQIDRARKLKGAPPPADWDGLVVMQSK